MHEHSHTEGIVQLKAFKMKAWENAIVRAMKFGGLSPARFIQNRGTLVHDTGVIKNLGMTLRLAVVSGLYVNSGAQTAFGYLAVGTDSTAVSAGQTTLVAELTTLGLGRALATASRTTTTSTNDTSQLTYTWTASGSTTVKEIGYFNAASAGVMGGRALTTDIPISSGIQLVGTYKIVHS